MGSDESTSRSTTLAALRESTLVGVVRESTEERARMIVDGLLASGLRAIELTTNTPGCFDLVSEYSQKVKHPEVVFGVGTIRKRKDVKAAAKAGATFAVFPNTDATLISAAQDRDLVVIPGALTPTEILTAHDLGADVVKIFPIAAVGGARYLDLIRGPLADLLFWVSGGVTLDDLPSYLGAGAALVGLTSALSSDLPTDVSGGVKARAQRALEIVARVR